MLLLSNQNRDNNTEDKSLLKIAKTHAISAMDAEIQGNFEKAHDEYILAAENLKKYILEQNKPDRVLKIALANYSKKINQLKENNMSKGKTI